MDIASGTIDKIVQLIQQRYPGWSSFKDDRFIKDEVAYKRKAAAKIAELLNEKEIIKLIEEKDYDELKKRVEKIAHSTNLLYVAVPLAGDLKVIHQKQLDPGSFWPGFRELLYGREESPERIEKFANYLKSNDLPCSWTFTTYFPYLVHPQTEIFLKPRALKWFLEFLGQPDTYTKYPSSSCYRYVQAACREIIGKMAEYGATDMVDMQSMIWVIASTESQDKVKKLTGDKTAKLALLFTQFEKEYWSLPQGKEHAAQYAMGQKVARENLALIQNAKGEGKDITDLVLLKLLPYNRNDGNVAKGAWTPIAPAITGDLKAWFEAKGWAKPQDWPKIAGALFDFIEGVAEKPDELDRFCKEFGSLAYFKGFQAGMLTPILSALNPDRFVLINNKSRKVLNYFTDSNFSQSIREYPQINDATLKFIGETRKIMTGEGGAQLHPNDLFDMFCHWLVAVAKYDFGKTNFWKISPGENAWNWEACRDRGYIAIGWDEIGDISGLSKKEFLEKWGESAKTHPNWTDAAANQVWTFSRLAEGDKIIANNGTTIVLGLGTVTGEYYYVPGERHGHRVPVDWYDTNQREVEQGGWRKTMVKLTEEEFNDIEGVKLGGAGFLSPVAFELLAGLDKTPTHQFYQENQEEIRKYVEKPVQELLKGVIDQFPQAMLDLLETEKGLFSRIRKNDWGRGGAWAYYWGAVYPKGEKRTSNVQLFISINKEMLRFGFYISDSAEEMREKFEANCKKHKNEIKDIIEGILPSGTKLDGRIEGGTREGTDLLKECQIGEWLQSPMKFSFSLSSSILRDAALKASGAALAEKVFALFKALFPLVILAAATDPMTKIYEFVEIDDEKQPPQTEYLLATCAEETGMEEAQLDVWIRALTRKGQAVLYGPPGTGKTFMAERIAKHMVGGGYGFMELVQFHPSYSYEDFIQGIRPQSTTDGKLEYPLMKGRFLEICQRARMAKGKCVLIIDEINRANLSSVMGEMMYLLEYRNREIPLAAGGKLQIPKNLYIIGTMNTADRSIALVDHALRRRFAFIALMPNYQVLKKYHERTDFDPDGLIEVLNKLNRQIGDSHYEVGITFFLLPDVREHLEAIWNMEIEPYLEEYFFDRRKIVDEYRWKKVKAEILSEAE